MPILTRLQQFIVIIRAAIFPRSINTNQYMHLVNFTFGPLVMSQKDKFANAEKVLPCAPDLGEVTPHIDT